MRLRFPFRALTLVAAAVVLPALFACDPGTTEERIEEAREEAAADPTPEPGPTEIVERSEGSFDLTLTGDLEETVQGVAVCTEVEVPDELRVSMQTDPPGERSYTLVVPGYEGTAKVQGEFQIGGAERSAGPVEVAVARVPGDMEVLEEGVTVSFLGTYAGAAGNGDVEGSVDCPIPDGQS